ncbi:MAG TPA: dienelactone hydrolase family protein [Candidatus Sulfomarinibacteraceae bacterium]|nr:dienelactone hydrolase family protein [Candidatus Sulfomarinibacteraceae bacterium]
MHAPPPRTRPARQWLAAAAAVLASACASIDHSPLDATAGDQGVRSDPDARFASEAVPAEPANHVVDTGRLYTVRRLEFPSAGDNGQPGDLVTVDYHQSTLPGAHPAVVILPIWGRHLYPSDAITKAVKRRSDGALHVLNVLGPSFLIDWPALGEATDETEFVRIWEEGAERETTTVVDVRRLLDWAEGRPEIDGERFGLVGFSHGAIVAPVVAAHDDRIAALVLVVGGAFPHRVIARCEGSRTATIQDRAAELFGWSRDEMEARLEPIYRHVDPARYPGRVDPAGVLIFEASRDDCIPADAREALWEAMGRPERWVIDASHRRAFFTMTPLYLNWMRGEIWRFLADRLLDPDPATTSP